MKQASYQEIRPKIKPGDIIAFSGRGFISSVIKWKTRSPVSHVGIVLRSSDKVKIIESTTMTEEKGVLIRRLSERVMGYDGEIWWLSLSSSIREKLDTVRMYRYLLQQNGKSYDYWQAIKSAILWWTREDEKTLFCSELCAAGLEAGGVWSGNSSEMTPRDIVWLDIYQDVVQIWGEPKLIF